MTGHQHINNAGAWTIPDRTLDKAKAAAASTRQFSAIHERSVSKFLLGDQIVATGFTPIPAEIVIKGFQQRKD